MEFSIIHIIGYILAFNGFLFMFGAIKSSEKSVSDSAGILALMISLWLMGSMFLILN